MWQKKTSSIGFWMFALVLLAGSFWWFGYPRPSEDVAEVLAVTQPQVTPAPTSLTQISGDGTRTLAIEKIGELVELSVNQEMIATKRVDPRSVVRIPFNTWSPNNKYFFITEQRDDKAEYLVMNESGKPFADGEPELKVSELYAQAYPDNTILSVSGWAAPTLIVLNARSESEENMSFWFDVQTQKFIRLATNFY
jgi:hypothetical protein